MKYILKEFPIHVAKTDNVYAENKFWKVNSQGIYSGVLNRFQRAIVVNNMHKYVLEELSRYDIKEPITSPVQICLDIYIPINYSTIRRTKGLLSWKVPKEDYKTNTDEDNVRWVWEKCIKDCLTKSGFWKDDDMYWCRGSSSLIHFIDDVKDRRIEISFKEVI